MNTQQQDEPIFSERTKRILITVGKSIAMIGGAIVFLYFLLWLFRENRTPIYFGMKEVMLSTPQRNGWLKATLIVLFALFPLAFRFMGAIEPQKQYANKYHKLLRITYYIVLQLMIIVVSASCMGSWSAELEKIRRQDSYDYTTLHTVLAYIYLFARSIGSFIQTCVGQAPITGTISVLLASLSLFVLIACVPVGMVLTAGLLLIVLGALQNIEFIPIFYV